MYYMILGTIVYGLVWTVYFIWAFALLGIILIAGVKIYRGIWHVILTIYMNYLK